jgi:hypothetical protein
VIKGTDSTREQLKKHTLQLASGILLGLKKKQRKHEDQEFVKSQEEFFDCFPAMPYSPPDFEDNLSYENCDFMVCGHQIDLPRPMTPINVEEAMMEFKWTETDDFPDEVFLMPLSTSDLERKGMH